MTDPRYGTLRETTTAGSREGGYQFSQLPLGEVEVLEQDGMHRTEARNRRPPGSYLIAENARARDDWIGRRPGTVEFLTAPDGNPVLKVVTVHLDADRRWVVRITKDDVHGAVNISGGWHQFTGSGTPTVDRRVTTTQQFGRLFLASPIKRITEINLGSKTYEEIEGAPRARHVVAYADRLVAGNVNDPIHGERQTLIQWSANGNPFEWDPLEDESAGEEPLDSAPSDFGDEITGLSVVGHTLVILRERSIWLVERQPVASNPFRFLPLVAGMGCDLPYSVATVPGGVIYADRRTNGVYQFSPGGAPQRISRPVEDQLFEDIENGTWVEAAFDPYEMEYHLGINVPNVLKEADGTTLVTEYITKVWVYNLKTQRWTYDIGPLTSTLGHVVGIHDLIMIDDLTDDIDDQVADALDETKPNPDGYIDDWGEDPDEIFRPSLFKGVPTGEVIYHTYPQCGHEWHCDRFEVELISQDLGSGSKRRTLKDFLFLSECPCPGAIKVAYSSDLVEWREMKLIRPIPHEHKERHGVPKQSFSGQQIYWRIRSDIPGFRLYEWWVRILEKGLQNQL